MLSSSPEPGKFYKKFNFPRNHASRLLLAIVGSIGVPANTNAATTLIDAAPLVREINPQKRTNTSIGSPTLLAQYEPENFFSRSLAKAESQGTPIKIAAEATGDMSVSTIGTDVGVSSVVSYVSEPIDAGTYSGFAFSSLQNPSSLEIYVEGTPGDTFTTIVTLQSALYTQSIRGPEQLITIANITGVIESGGYAILTLTPEYWINFGDFALSEPGRISAESRIGSQTNNANFTSVNLTQLGSNSFEANFTPIPEPNTATLGGGLALGALLLRRRDDKDDQDDQDDTWTQ